MRTVTYGAACSLDGFITGRDGEVDWISFTRDAGKIMEEYWNTVDAILMGRKTYEFAAAQGGSGGDSFAGVNTYVFSRTMKQSPHPDVQLVNDNAGDFVRELKGQTGRGICLMGGSDLARSLFQAGAIDEVGVNIHPVLLGAGTPLFRDPGLRTNLTLTESRTLEGGCVYATYRVTG